MYRENIFHIYPLVVGRFGFFFLISILHSGECVCSSFEMVILVEIWFFFSFCWFVFFTLPDTHIHSMDDYPRDQFYSRTDKWVNDHITSHWIQTLWKSVSTVQAHAIHIFIWLSVYLIGIINCINLINKLITF